MAGRHNRRSRRRGEERHTYINDFLTWPNAVALVLFTAFAAFVTSPKWMPYAREFYAEYRLNQEFLAASEIGTSKFQFKQGGEVDTIRVAATSRLDSTHAWQLTYILDDRIGDPRKELVFYAAHLDSDNLNFIYRLSAGPELGRQVLAFSHWFFHKTTSPERPDQDTTYGYTLAIQFSHRAQYENIINHLLGEQKPTRRLSMDTMFDGYKLTADDQRRIKSAMEKGEVVPYNPADSIPEAPAQIPVEVQPKFQS